MKKTLLLALLLTATPAFAATFDHSAHRAVESDCAVCHIPGEASIVPDKQVCFSCHAAAEVSAAVLPPVATHGPTWGLSHKVAASAAGAECAACHIEQTDCLDCHKAGFADEQGMLNVHRSDFQITHPIAAKTDPQLCSTCHESKFCSECHDEFRRDELAGVSHRRGWSDLTLSPSGAAHSSFNALQCATCHPDSVLPTHTWSSEHAREARKNLATCQACHPDGDVCLTCHSAQSGLGVNPHPKDFDKIKNRLKDASGAKTCRRCH